MIAEIQSKQLQRKNFNWLYPAAYKNFLLAVWYIQRSLVVQTSIKRKYSLLQNLTSTAKNGFLFFPSLLNTHDFLQPLYNTFAGLQSKLCDDVSK